jgi:lipopolysaccharide transport system ATP-binding protein
MSPPIVQVRGLGKRYRLGATLRHNTLRDPLAAAARRWAGRAPPPDPKAPAARRDGEFWALRGVDLDVGAGEVLGVIGRNGAGKSTLLKILSRITEPTEGEIRLRGRVASLLEVGTGFHPELSGRENVFLNGAILGMARAEIRAKFDEIVAFAGVEEFIDTPVKRYSSGMYVRLAFAVAAHLEPEILLVDEVLAVGDAEFQDRCLGKMREVTGRHGRTVLFVSHNMAAVRSLCRRAVRLERGAVAAAGDVEEVVAAYLQFDRGEVLRQAWDDPATAPGNDRVRLRRAELLYAGRDEGRPILTRTPLRLRLEAENLVEGQELNFSTRFFGPGGEIVFNVWTEARPFPRGVVSATLEIPGDFLNDGVYAFDCMLVSQARCVYLHDAVVRFRVHDDRTGTRWYGRVQGSVRPRLFPFPIEFRPGGPTP